MRFVALIGAAAALSMAAFTSANANVITVGGSATITCTPSCQAIVGGTIVDVPGPGLGGTAGMLSSMTGDLYDFSPSNPTEEALALNVLAGTSFAPGTQTDTGGVSALSFSSTAAWIALKLGVGHVFIFNAGGMLDIDFLANNLRGGGLSHITEFGESDVVPVPGAIWLMGAGLAGLGFARRRQVTH